MRRFSRRMEKCAQSMPQVMAHACADRTWKSGVSASLTWMAVVMMTGREWGSVHRHWSMSTSVRG